MAFPSSPTNGQLAVLNGITYTYTSSTNSWTRASAALPSLSVVTDTFTSDGVTTVYSLSQTPPSIDYITVNIDGVSQLKSAFTLTSNQLTLTGTPVSGAIIDVKSTNATNIGVLTGLVFDTFTGTGSQTNFTLSTSPTNKNYTMVSIGGLTQNKNNYSISGTTLTFTTAPPNTSPIEVVTFGPAINTAQAQGANTQVQMNINGNMGASANLTFNTSTNTLSTVNITNTGNVTATGSVTSSGDVKATNILHPFFLSGL
jgi:hypothetical protein